MSFYLRQEDMGLNTDIKVAIAGCGGVGFNVALQLAMSGVEHLYLFDHDIVEQHNLNRIAAPFSEIGSNKADLAKRMIKDMRPDINVYRFPSRLKQVMLPSDLNWIVDCTDEFEAQKEIYQIAKSVGASYCKPGYDGENMSINNSIGEWDTGDTPDGYQIIPSWSAPANIVASLTVAKILKYHDKEMAGNVKNMFG